MSPETIISILLSVPIGVIGGLYSGLIVTKYARFSDLRNQLLRIIRKIQFIATTGNSMKIWNDEDVPNIILVQSDLYFLQHREAGHSVGRLCSEIMEANRLARSGRINIDDYSERHRRWQHEGRKLKPRMQTIFSLWPNL
jgi:hypothetical protein